jgi:sulfite reductase (NADPH) flavoprotein alpha-component
MLVDSKLKILQQLISGATNEELVWIHGYLNGIVAATSTKDVVSNVVNKITILYGTETGNSKKLAVEFAALAKKKSIHAKVIGMDQYKLTDLPKEEYLFVLISTHGEGEPPIAAKDFYNHIHSYTSTLSNLKYGVLALGDTSYPLFCKTGEEVDEQLYKLGGKRIVPLQKCDVEYENEASTWFANVLLQLNNNTSNAVAVEKSILPIKKIGKQSFTGTVLTHINLNDKGSNSETFHIEIAAERVDYQCGDSIGIVPENPTEIVLAIIDTVGADPSTQLIFKNVNDSIFNILKYKINIIHLTERLVKLYAEHVQQQIPLVKMNLLDLLKIYPVKNVEQFQQIIVQLNAISPRLYTIASSPAAHPTEIHVLALKEKYTANNMEQIGLCSNYLSQLVVGSTQQFFVQANKRFRLPAANKDIIMVGPGTGIAAFRSFLAERDATGATGKNWLFFGEQHFASDFLYQTEIQNWVETGVLTKINVAFSDDQDEKIYVQHKMLQHATEIFNWLQAGAYFYICGKKEPMGIDVEKALLLIIEQQGNFTAQQAKEYIETLAQQGRYEKDVY